MPTPSISGTPGGTTEQWPKRFLIFIIDHTEHISARSEIITIYKENGYASAQDVAEAYFEDHSVMRIYELRQMFGTGRLRG